MIKEKVKLESMISEKQIGMQEFSEDLLEINKKIENFGGEKLKKQRKIVDENNQYYNALEKEISKMTAQIENNKKIVKQINKELNEEKLKVEDCKIKIKELQEKNQNLENEAIKYLGYTSAEEEKAGRLKNEIQEQSDEKKKIEDLIKELKKNIDLVVNELDASKANLKYLKLIFYFFNILVLKFY